MSMARVSATIVSVTPDVGGKIIAVVGPGVPLANVPALAGTEMAGVQNTGTVRDNENEESRPPENVSGQ
jgi:hypothetical protein